MLPAAPIDKVFPTKKQAKRYNQGKMPMSYILTFWNALKGVAAVSKYGEQKYERGNYLKGAPLSQYVDCMMRHLGAWWNGEDNDSESRLPHLSHFAWNALCLVEMSITQPQRDDRLNQKNIHYITTPIPLRDNVYTKDYFDPGNLPIIESPNKYAHAARARWYNYLGKDAEDVSVEQYRQKVPVSTNDWESP